MGALRWMRTANRRSGATVRLCGSALVWGTDALARPADAAYILLYIRFPEDSGKKSMAGGRSKPSHITRGDVLDDLGFSPEQATILKFKADLYQAILKHARKYSQTQLQVILAEPQPRVSELLNGKIANKSVDKLLYYAGRLGIEAKARFPQTNKQVVQRELAAAAR